MLDKKLALILNKHKTLDNLIEKLHTVKTNRYSQWSAEKQFIEAIPNNVYGRPGLYQVFYKGKLVYLGSSNTNNGKRTYGLHDRLQKKKTILCKHFANADMIMSLKEVCMKKAISLDYDMHYSNWSYRYWILPVDVPLVLEIMWIKKLKAEGYCELNSNRSCNR